MPIEVKITGAKDSDAEYEESAYLRGEEKFRQAVMDFYDTGARIDNIEDSIRDALSDAGADE